MPIRLVVVSGTEKDDIYITRLGKWMKLLTDEATQHSSLSVQVPLPSPEWTQW